ncbi:MAG: tripartite tricarboxylate transporter substrate binding protein [Betaproteobacteria bacterium]
MTKTLRRMRRRVLAGIVASLALASTTPFAQGQYPAKPVRLIVPFPPGAGTDTVARYIAQKLTDALGQPVVVENRTRAGGAIGASEAAKSDADGYTLLFVASPFTTVAASNSHAGYDPISQFVPVASIASGPLAFVVNVDVPARTLREFIALARREPGRLNYGSAGTGSVNHLALELFNERTGAQVVHVPYRGIADATKDLLGGQIQAMTASIPATLPQLAEHKVKVLAVTGKHRVAQMPGVPSWQEEGVADAEVINYWGIVAPAGTPAAIVARLNNEIARLLAQPDVVARLTREGVEIISGPPQRLGTLIADDLGNWRRLIKDAKLGFD